MNTALRADRYIKPPGPHYASAMNNGVKYAMCCIGPIICDALIPGRPIAAATRRCAGGWRGFGGVSASDLGGVGLDRKSAILALIPGELDLVDPFARPMPPQVVAAAGLSLPTDLC